MVDLVSPEKSLPLTLTRAAGVFGEAFFAFLTTFWFGLLLGVSFLATPVKFRAPSLELPVALDVGRVTFALFSKVELGLCLILLLFLPVIRAGAVRALTVTSVVAIVLVEAFWLLPVLDARVGEIMAGATVPETSHHLWYIVAEIVQAVLLLGLAIDALLRLAKTAVPERA